MTQPNAQNFVLTQPMHFESGPFDGKAGDVCVWRHPGQLVIYRATELVANFPMAYVSVQALKSDRIFSLGTKSPKGLDLSHVPDLGKGVPQKPIVKLPHVDVVETVVTLPPVAAPVIEEEAAAEIPETEEPQAETEAHEGEPEGAEAETEEPQAETEEPTVETEAPKAETSAPKAPAVKKPAARRPAAKKAK